MPLPPSAGAGHFVRNVIDKLSAMLPTIQSCIFTIFSIVTVKSCIIAISNGVDSADVVHRTDTTGEANPLTGLLFCADCGAKMYNHKRGDNYNCSTYVLTSKWSERKCCSHYISSRAVRALLLDTIRTVSTYAIGRNINKYHQFLHQEIEKYEGKTEQKTA